MPCYQQRNEPDNRRYSFSNQFDSVYANLTRQQSEEGQDTLEDPSNISRHAINSCSQNSNHKWTQLIKVTQDISELCSTIEQITSQINLLSLNASIEAARSSRRRGKRVCGCCKRSSIAPENTEKTAASIRLLVSSIASQVGNIQNKRA